MSAQLASGGLYQCTYQFAGGGGGGDGRLKLRIALKIYRSPKESLTGPGLSATLRAPTRHQIVVPGVVKKLLAPVTLIGPVQLARGMAADASALYARNLFNFLAAFWDKDRGAPLLAEGDDIVDAIRLTRGGAIVSERLSA